MATEQSTVFDRLFAVDVSNQIEKKDAGNGKSLSYLSWSFAWANVKKRFPDANYEICKFGENQLPYVYDKNTGYMVFTKVTKSTIARIMVSVGIFLLIACASFLFSRRVFGELHCLLV